MRRMWTEPRSASAVSTGSIDAGEALSASISKATLPVGSPSLTSGLVAQRVRAPDATAGSGEVKEDEAIEQNGLALVDQREELHAHAGMRQEVADRAHARRDERHRP